VKTPPASLSIARGTAAGPGAGAPPGATTEDSSNVDAAPVAPVRRVQPAEPRQRWRLVYRRSGGAPGVSQRDELAAWEAALVASGLPIAGLDGPRGRPRLAFGAPLAAGLAAERELADILLTRKVTIDAVRGALAARLPEGHELVDLFDVWLGAPPLAAQVVAADYRIRLVPESPDAWEVASAANRLLARESIQRQRPQGGGQVRYDLRPLLGGIDVRAPGPPVVMRVRTRFDPQLGAGRPEEVLAALGELIGRPCVAADTVRERLILGGED
jgi:radical SAM-linked protein